MTYNLTNLTTAENIGDVARTANNYSQGVLFGGALIAFFFVMLMSLLKWGFDVALTVSAWSCFILGLFLALGEFVSILYPLAFLAIAAFGTLWLYASGRL